MLRKILNQPNRKKDIYPNGAPYMAILQQKGKGIIESRFFKKVRDIFVPLSIFVVGLWFSVLKAMGTGLSYIPGDLGDNRFNNYVLEHFYRWITRLDPTYWSASFFYPFPNTIAFSDNLLGSAFFYAGFRRIGLDRETAFQAWYILGFLFNFIAAYYVLKKLGFTSLAGGAGAFFFSFGLPLWGQQGHAQLIYRCAIPLACYFLWDFSETPRIWKLILLSLSIIWQIYLSIYNGIFLLMLVAVMVILLPFFVSSRSLVDWLSYWPRRLIGAWQQESLIHHLYFLILVLVEGVGSIAILYPYYSTSRIYGFARNWSSVETMLPRLRSFFLADNSLIWGKWSSLITGMGPFRWEHQLFPGLTVVVLVLIGLIWRPKSESRRIAWLAFWTVVILVGITFDFQGHSIYRLLITVPGLNSLRSVTRIVLVLMWPGAIFIAYALDALLRLRVGWLHKNLQYGFAYLLIGMLLFESLAVKYTSFSKADAQNRLNIIMNTILTSVPQDPILVLSSDGKQYPESEIDAMLVAQELGWPVFNGYSGNFPPGYNDNILNMCRVIPDRIISYMKFANISNESFYLGIMKRVVPVGFDDCDQEWWIKMP
jgi:hypothetical protein